MPRSPVLRLLAPLSGRLVPLDQVPDAVFAQGMAGEGVAINPSSTTVLAPCDGRVVHVHPTGHAVALVTSGGVGLMVHVGLDTAHLGGGGFTPLVAAGDAVTCGMRLVEFDRGYVIARGASLLSPLLVMPSAGVTGVRAATGVVSAGLDVALEVDVAPASEAEEAAPDGVLVSGSIRIIGASGLHARPAAVIADAARAFDARVWLERATNRADARSVIALVALDAAAGATVRLAARGPDAARAIAELTPLVAWGLGDRLHPNTAAALPSAGGESAPPDGQAGDDAVPGLPPRVLRGVSASPGLVVGAVFRLERADASNGEHARGPAAEHRRLARATERVRAALVRLQARTRRVTDPGMAAVIGVQQAFLGDDDLVASARVLVDEGWSAERAWTHAIEAHAARLGALRSPLLASRARELRDVGRLVARALGGAPSSPIPAPRDAILVADEITLPELASLDRRRVLGVVTTGGSGSSHAAVLARGLGLPLVAAVPPRALDLANGTPVILDGTAGTLIVEPTADEVSGAVASRQRQTKHRADDLAHADAPAVTRDGRRVYVTGSIGSVDEADGVVAAGGDGVGLLRSEFLFLDRLEAPGEDEQAELYGRMAAALGPGRILVVRTFDAGGDKPLPYLSETSSSRAAVGPRGFRASLARAELFRTQLRAILRASAHGCVRVMFPLVSQLDEWREAKAMLEEERARLALAPIEAGLMVEVPAAALMADAFAREADFLSIGTNDLAQFTLAVDRSRTVHAARCDALDPAVLRLVASTFDAARRHGRRVGVCGLAAMDPQAIPLLVGLGVDELSVSVPDIPAVKAQVRSLDRTRCRALADRAIECSSADEVRALVASQGASAK